MQVEDIGIDAIYTGIKPIYDALHPFALILGFIAFSFWLVFKVIAILKKQETVQGIIFKGVSFLVFFLFWQQLFISFFMLNDAASATISGINLSSTLPGFEPGDSQIMDNVIETMYRDSSHISEAYFSMLYSDDEELAQSIENENELNAENSETSFLKKSGHYLTKKTGEFFDKTISDIKRPFIIAGHVVIANLMGFLAVMAKKMALLVRLGFSFFYCVAIPFLIVCSYFPVLGDQSDQGGLNNFSKKTVNWCINMALWPTFFALLDKILVVMYYNLKAIGAFDEFTTFLAFFCFYLISYLTIPFAIQRANPYGVMQGMISSVSTIATVSAISLTAAAPIAKGAGSFAGGKMKSMSSGIFNLAGQFRSRGKAGSEGAAEPEGS